jgi:hypothetical protein
VFAVGQGSDVAFDIHQGDLVYVCIGDREYTVEVGGVIYDATVQPPNFGGNAHFYTTRARLADLTGRQGFNRVLASAERWDETQVTLVLSGVIFMTVMGARDATLYTFMQLQI